MRRPLAIALLLGACATPDGVPSPPSGSKPGTTFGEPISTQQVLQGIQIGEGGDLFPCDPVLTPLDEGAAEALFAELEGSWELPYGYEGLSGTADVSVALSSTWELTWTDAYTSSTVDCTTEAPATVGALWLDIDSADASVHQPVFASTLDAPPTGFVGEVPGMELGLDGTTYDVVGRVDGGALVLWIYEDLVYAEPLGAFGD